MEKNRVPWFLLGPLAGALFLAVGAAGAGHAAESAPAPKTVVLTVEDVRRITLERSRAIRKAEQYGAGVRGRYLEEKAAALPQLTVAALASAANDQSVLMGSERTDLLALSATVTQPLYTWGRIPAAIRAAEVGLAMAGDRLRRSRQTALRDALLAWYDALLAAELQSLAAQDLARKERLLGEARRKYEAGTATDYDILAAEVSLQNARPAVIRAANLVRATRERLRFQLALGEEVALELHGRLDARVEAHPDYPAALEEARRRRPDLAELRNRRKVAEEVATIRRAGNKPRLDLSGSVGWQSLWVDGPDGDGLLWSAGVAFTWPLFDGRRTRGLVMEAESDAALLGIEEGELLDGIALEARRAVDDLREAAGIMEALAGTVAQAERLLAMAEKGYEYGVKTRLDVDDAQLNLTRACGNLAQARRDYLVARVSLDWVTGALGE